ncbi:MAG: SAM-dependent methyltransferase [Planctomycetota bacterium]|jgi:23S rRNA (cytidine1920-2'-O)/16S rRNA (cytidine1409-2'-O)-methyltransferase
MAMEDREFVSRGGVKLQAALDAFELDVRGLTCADFGCNVGGFTDCLLQNGAGKVYAVDTGYGELAWKLRNDPRVVVMERTNALHCELPEAVDLVTIDVGWTPQERIVPAAMGCLAPGGLIVSLLKPHYELSKLAHRKPHAPLSAQKTCEVCRNVCQRLMQQGCCIRAVMRSVLAGKGGNVEFFLLLALGEKGR